MDSRKILVILKFLAFLQAFSACYSCLEADALKHPIKQSHGFPTHTAYAATVAVHCVVNTFEYCHYKAEGAVKQKGNNTGRKDRHCLVFFRAMSLTPLTCLAVFVSQEALMYYNQTTKQREMLEFALNYLQTDDEVRFRCHTGEVSGQNH